MIYQLIRPLLFLTKPETAHTIALRSLRALGPVADLLLPSIPENPVQIMGITFPNPVGLAAGLDKNADYIDALAKLGFGFIEVGTLTPRPQAGNTKPRLFRLPQSQALINRMGFNNHGIDYAIEQIRRSKYQGILGINIGKNAATAMEQAVDDYVHCLHKAYPYASYITVNISSPNTAGLRDLQYGNNLLQLLTQLKLSQQKLTRQYSRYVPLAVKVAPDLDSQEIEFVAQTLLDHEIDALIATNTTFSRLGVEHFAQAKQSGGLSGAPLTQQATETISQFNAVLQGRVPIIAAGGIMSGYDATAKIVAGASLVQLYTGLIYQGPGLVAAVAKHLQQQNLQ